MRRSWMENRVGACVVVGTTLVEKFVVRQVDHQVAFYQRWCTRSPCKCTVHEALGAITIPDVSARFIVRVSDLYDWSMYSRVFSPSIAGTRELTRAPSTFSSGFFSSSKFPRIQFPGRKKKIEEIERATPDSYPRMRSSKFPS